MSDSTTSQGKNSLPPAERANPFNATDVSAVLKERGWLAAEPNEVQLTWCARAAALLGPYAIERTALAELLSLVFEYDAQAILQTTEAHVILSRNAARDVLRQVALCLLEDSPLTTDRFKEVITVLKDGMDFRSRDLFHPLRLALAGRVGEGELDRVILLLDDAAAAGFACSVKTARIRILEFCATLD